MFVQDSQYIQSLKAGNRSPILFFFLNEGAETDRTGPVSAGECSSAASNLVAPVPFVNVHASCSPATTHDRRASRHVVDREPGDTTAAALRRGHPATGGSALLQNGRQARRLLPLCFEAPEVQRTHATSGPGAFVGHFVLGFQNVTMDGTETIGEDLKSSALRRDTCAAWLATAATVPSALHL